jgi:Mrp family chromosome partitioning ATPase
MKDIVQQKTGVVLSSQESMALQSLAMLPLQLLPTRVSLTLPFERLATLLRSIRYRLTAASETPVIHFVSPRSGDGADVIAFELAYVASTQPGKRVLFINTGVNSRGVSSRVDTVVPAASAVIEGDAPPEAPLEPETSFFFTTISDPANHERLLPEARDFKKVLDDLRKVFDLVVVHSDAALTSQMAVTLFGLTDGAIIVAEAEGTRIPVIRQLRALIETHGGRVLGVVLNKRRYYIPKFLYSLLFRG